MFSFLSLWFSSFISPLIALFFNPAITSFLGASLFGILMVFLLVGTILPILLRANLSNAKGFKSDKGDK